MNKISFFILYNLFFSLHILAQNQDSLVIYHDLVFKDRYEQEAFQHQFKSDSIKVMLQFFMAPHHSNTSLKIDEAENKFSAFTVNLKKKIANKSAIEQIAILKEKVESTYLISYKANCGFNEIFSNGNYDCISAISLYAIVLNQLNIPYQILSSGNSFFIKAYPDEAGILIENTSKKYIESFSKNCPKCKK
jgi:hypothetical protein